MCLHSKLQSLLLLLVTEYGDPGTILLWGSLFMSQNCDTNVGAKDQWNEFAKLFFTHVVSKISK